LSGPVVAPKRTIPHADDAAASFCSIKPRTAAGQPAQRRCPGGKVGYPTVGSFTGKNRI
jgi:hypothetical protein